MASSGQPRTRALQAMFDYADNICERCDRRFDDVGECTCPDCNGCLTCTKIDQNEQVFWGYLRELDAGQLAALRQVVEHELEEVGK